MSFIFLIGCSKDAGRFGANSARQQAVSQEYAYSGSKRELTRLIFESEAKYGIPHGYLHSIAVLESGLNPYAVNASKVPLSFSGKEQATKFVKNKLMSGTKNISVGCMQIHVCHAKHFGSISDLVDPEKNIRFAALLLRRLYDKYGSWKIAIRMYHCGEKLTRKSKSRGELYYQKVMQIYNTNRATLNQSYDSNSAAGSKSKKKGGK